MPYLNFASVTFFFLLFSNCPDVDLGTPQFERLLAQIFQIILGFVSPCIFTHSNKSTSQMQQLITGLLLVV